jgi:C4-dicarboxylate-specific signal transduction histidine kinase
MRDRPARQLTITTEVDAKRVAIRFRDTGSGVSNPERLFRPFQRQATAAGLGLYLSRAFMRSFRGDLKFEPEPDGASFIVELTRAGAEKEPVAKETYEAANSDSAGGRP